MDIPSRVSSPLTPLSSLDDSDDSMLSSSGRTSAEIDDLAAAQVCDSYLWIHHVNLPFQLLCNMATGRKSTSLTVASPSRTTKKLADRGVQTNLEDLSTPVVRNKVGRPRKVSENCAQVPSFHIPTYNNVHFRTAPCAIFNAERNITTSRISIKWISEHSDKSYHLDRQTKASVTADCTWSKHSRTTFSKQKH